jgi:anti-sigma factor RsiW
MSECTHNAPMLTARPGELTAIEESELGRHLEACVHCRAQRALFLATEGLLAEGLLAKAAERDFAPFTDAVMARVSRRHNRRGRLFDWVSHHRVRAALSALAPTFAAAALVVYFHGPTTDDTPAPHHLFELTSECGVSTVLKTEQGPVVLMGDDGDDGDDAP